MHVAASQPGGVSEPAVLLIVILLLVAGCGPSVPPSPASEEIWTVRHQEDHSLVTTITIELNGQILNNSSVSIPAGRPVRVTGAFTLDHNRIPKGLHLGALLVRLMPAGTTDDGWEAVGRSFKYADQFAGPATQDLDYESPVKAAPGEYDARVYSSISDARDMMPHHHLVCRGKVTITP